MNPNRIIWTEAMDDRIRAARAGGMSWTKIGRMMGLGRNSVLNRGRELGMHEPKPVAPVVKVEKRSGPLAPGSSVTWDLISSVPMKFVCTECGAPAIAVNQATNDLTCELLGTVLLLKRGEPSVLWCARHWEKRFAAQVAS